MTWRAAAGVLVAAYLVFTLYFSPNRGAVRTVSRTE